MLLGFVLLQRPDAPGMTALSQGALYVAVVVFYALEMLVGHSARTRAWLWRGGAAFLVMLAVRGLEVT